MEPAHTRSPEMPAPIASMASRLNWLRAAVLGANDGIVSTAALMAGVAGAGLDARTLFITGLSALVAGAFSMGVGEYISVSSQRDSERAAIEREKKLLSANPTGQIDQLAHMYENIGLTPATAHKVAEELSQHGSDETLAAHLDIEYGIDPDELTNAWAAAFSSMISFTLGALIPLLAVVIAPHEGAIVALAISTIVALTLTGITSATVGKARILPAVLRTVLGGALALGGTYLIGLLFNTPVA